MRVKDLLSPRASSLKLRLVAGKKGLRRRIETSRVIRYKVDRVDKKDDLTPGSILLAGSKELDTLTALPQKNRKEIIDHLGAWSIAAFVIAGRTDTPNYLTTMARREQLPLLRTTLGADVAARRVRSFIEKLRSRSMMVHGVLMDIYGLGTLIIGESGIGKSESALELIERGHRLVSDDIIEFYREAGNQSPCPGILMGRSPNLTRYFMELRGVGIINVKDLFGLNSIRMRKSVDLVIQLERWEKATEIERLGLEEETYAILGGSLPLVRMPVGPGRNLAMLIEVAARNHLLKRAGRHPARRLIKKVNALARRAPKP